MDGLLMGAMEGDNRKLWQHHVLFAALGLALVGLSVRLFVFQRRCEAEMVRRAELQQRMVVPIPGCRGKIYTRGFSAPMLLAASRQVPSCFADPFLIPDDRLVEVSALVGEALGMASSQVLERLTQRRDARFVWLKRGRVYDEPDRLSARQAQAVEELRIHGVGIVNEWERYYPNGSLAAHVVGFAGVDGQGLEGVELWAEQYLSARDGRRVLRVDARRQPIANFPEQYTPPDDGSHVELTIDPVIQAQLEKVLAQTRAKFKAESAVGIVVDPMTGEVLALANDPTYNLNAFGAATRDERRNRAITDPYEPGSIFKPFTAVMALADGKARLGEMFNGYGGAYPVRRGRTIRDAHGRDRATFEESVYLSLNTILAQLGQRLGRERLYDVVRSFGFGAPTGIELRGEDAGLVNPLRQWNLDTIVSVPMGQEIGVTCLQMAMGFSALANGGDLLRPRLVRKISAPDGQVLWDNSAVVVTRSQVVDRRVAQVFLEQVMAKVPTDGTGRTHARLNGWTSFGKTGTAQIAPYSGGRFTASYIAGAPVHNPRLVCLISVRKPDRSVGHYGGTVAGPAVKQVLEASLAYLGVPKDQPEPPARRGAGSGH